MNRRTAIIIALQAFLIVMLFWVLVFYGKDEYEAYVQGAAEEEIETPNRVSTEQGIPVVTLPRAAQEQSGIEIIRLPSSEYVRVLSAYGTVVNIDSLIEQRGRYFTAKAEASAANASLANTQQEFKRLTLLNQDNRNVSDRAVANAEALLKADQAKLNMAENAARSLRDSIGQQWGAILAAQATQSTESHAFTRLMQYRDVLIQVTLPFDTPTPSPGSTITVTPAGASGQSVQAQFVSASPVADRALSGKTYYYRAAADTLRVGMHVSIALSDSRNEPIKGVIVPGSAIVWYGGQAWVYRKDENDRFVRIPAHTDSETNGGWFNSAGLQADDEIVVTGAQLLLSEEFKYQITNENDD